MASIRGEYLKRFRAKINIQEMGVTAIIVTAIVQQLEALRGGDGTAPLRLHAQRVTLMKVSRQR